MNISAPANAIVFAVDGSIKPNAEAAREMVASHRTIAVSNSHATTSLNASFCNFLLSVDGYSEVESKALLKELIEFCTQHRFTYSHRWRVGDVLSWDQRAVLHRATPWPAEQPRTLSSLCVSVTQADGIDAMRL